MRSVAIIGSGAAAYGVMHALQAAGDLDITVIDAGQDPDGPFKTTLPVPAWPVALMRHFYHYLHRHHGLSFPPPKTSFGLYPEKRSVAGSGQIWDNHYHGGLTAFWGLSAVPFDDAEFDRWPVSAAQMRPHYCAIADDMGIAGGDDRSQDIITRPSALTAPLAEKLLSLLKQGTSETSDDYLITPASALLAMETRLGHPHACIGCGACMTGCPNGAMFSTRTRFAEWRAANVIRTWLPHRITAIDFRTRCLTYNTDQNPGAETSPFDAIFLCAGAFSSAEIVLRSQNSIKEIIIADSGLYTFPIFHFGKIPKTQGYQHIALTNAMLTLQSLSPAGQTVSVQFYAFFDYLWQYYTPVFLWPLFRPFGQWMRRHFLLGRLYLDGDHAARIAVTLDERDKALLCRVAAPAPLRQAGSIWPTLRRTLARAGFHTARMIAVSHKTSSHYLGGLPMGGSLVAANGEMAPGIYLCDSLNFPTAPAVSPTLTIMANARRIAAAWLEKEIA